MRRFWIIVLILGIVSAAYAQALTVAQALAIGNELEHEGVTSESYTIEGYVNVITDNQYSSSYNNMTFWIADTRGTKSSSANGALQVYRGRPNQELVEGDKVRVVAKLKKYYSTIETTPYNVPVTWLEPEPDGGGEGEENVSPVDLPEVGNGRLKVFAQNVENYYYNYNTGRGKYTREEFAEKTRKMVDAMLMVDADIFALCELEAKPIILTQLADSMNKRIPDANPYVAVSDGIDVEWDAEYNNNIKSGFIYRSDKVKTYGTNYASTTVTYYKNTQRIQTFEELSSGERFTISMNHFRSKKNGGGDEQRVKNANYVLNGLSSYYYCDQDILILGDLNCEVGEEPITILQNAGYEEQLLKYDSESYSYCYSGSGQLIDHAMANNTMAAQITGAGVFHISTTCGADAYKNVDYRYSDHDPYVVGLCLGTGDCNDTPTDIDSVQPEQCAIKTIENGQLIITLPDGSRYNVIGIRIR